MQFKKFSLLTQGIESGEVLKAIEAAIPAETIEQVLNQTDSRETRKRKLPSHLVVALVIAMGTIDYCLWHQTDWTMAVVVQSLLALRCC
jgi:uncharacterized membrane protein YdbT with pleckstrin-like domain